MITLLGTGAMALGPLLDDGHPLERVGEAFTGLEQRTAIRPIITLWLTPAPARDRLGGTR